MKYIPTFFLCIIISALVYNVYAAENFIVAPKRKRAPKITNEQLCNQFDELMHRFSNILQLLGKMQKKILHITRALLEGNKNNNLVASNKEERKKHAEKTTQFLRQVRIFEKQLQAYMAVE